MKNGKKLILILSVILTFLMIGICAVYTIMTNTDKGTFYSAEEIGQIPIEKIDLNTASEEELTALPYIGETLSKRIIRYREEHHGFQTTEELRNINGIGEEIYKTIYLYLTVS